MTFADLLSSYGSLYVKAALSTWSMTAIAFIFAMVLALLITTMRVSSIRPLRRAGDFYVQVFRNIPGISLLIIIAYALPYLQITLDWNICVILTVILVASSFASENFMSGINTIGVGQIEAARSLGMSFGKMLRLIIIPQALRSVILPMTNLLVAVMLTTAIGSQVPLDPAELTGLVSHINTFEVGGILPFVISAVIYAGTAFIIGMVGNALDKKVRIIR